MKYYYDIYLNFYEYPLNYYEWEKNDNIERILKIPIIKVDSIKDIILYNTKIEINENMFILTDGVSCIALELIDKKVAYLSYLPYDDELSINEISSKMEITNLNITYYDKRVIPTNLRCDEIIKKIILKSLNSLDVSLINYIYYEITNKEDKNTEYIKKFLRNDIINNFDERYIKLYYDICKLN